MACDDSQHEYRRKSDAVRLLLQRELEGLSLRSNTVKREDRPLFVAAIRYFRNWGEALRAAGLDPEAISCKRSWTKERVIRSIRELERQLAPLNVKAVRKRDASLTQAARRLWGSWDQALLAAGFDPTRVRPQRVPWTRSTLVDAIQAHAATGAPLTRNAIRPRSLSHASCRLFGSFEAALEAAGVLEQRNAPFGWSREKVVAGIRRRLQTGASVNCAAVVNADPSLYDAGRRYHGSWDQALRAAGIEPESVRAVRPEWTRQRVIEELRRRVAEGVPPTCVSSIRPISLVKACRKLFGSCEAAALAAGVEPAKIGYCRLPRYGLRQPGKHGGRHA